MATGQSLLSLLASLLYIAVAACCCFAAWASRRAGNGEGDAAGWLAGAAIFATLFAMRHFGVETAFQSLLRGWLLLEHEYEFRREFQAPVAALGFALIGAIGLWAGNTLHRHRQRRLKQLRTLAAFSVGAMIGLVFLRVVSFHAVDKLLFEGPHLNWLIDVGSSLLTSFCAVRHGMLVRRYGPRGHARSRPKA